MFKNQSTMGCIPSSDHGWRALEDVEEVKLHSLVGGVAVRSSQMLHARPCLVERSEPSHYETREKSIESQGSHGVGLSRTTCVAQDLHALN